MDIRPPEPRSAARILRRELADLGLQLKYTQALNIVAKMQGFQSLQALQAHLETMSAVPAIAPPMPEMLVIATYEHRHGRDVCVFRTEAGAEAWRTGIAKEFWAEEMGDEEIPPDDEIADAYFDELADRGREFFTIETGIALRD